MTKYHRQNKKKGGGRLCCASQSMILRKVQIAESVTWPRTALVRVVSGININQRNYSEVRSECGVEIFLFFIDSDIDG